MLKLKIKPNGEPKSGQIALLIFMLAILIIAGTCGESLAADVSLDQIGQQ